MERRLSVAQIVGLVGIAVIFGVIAMIFGTVTPDKSSDQPEYISYKKPSGIYMKLNGDYLVYVELGSIYEEQGVTAMFKNKDITEDVIITYFQNDTEIFNIDTNQIGTYTIKYTVMYKEEIKVISRAVIISDTKAPTISIPEKQTITSVEAASFDLNQGVIASDNSGDVDLTYDNTLSTLNGDYIITYKAKDKAGNETVRKRLIKVVSGIEFSYDNKLSIKYPPSPNKSKYVYKYSLDGGDSWQDAEYKTELSVSSGTVIASVYENDIYIMSDSYTIK